MSSKLITNNTTVVAFWWFLPRRPNTLFRNLRNHLQDCAASQSRKWQLTCHHCENRKFQIQI